MENNTTSKISTDGLFRQNIVLMSGLVTAPIIVAATTFERALILSISFFLISYTTILVCRAIPRKIVYTIRIMLYAAVAAIMYIPTAMLLYRLFPDTLGQVILYIELIVVNSLVLAKAESRFYLLPMGKMAIDVLIYILGYVMAAFSVGIIRELLAYGTLFGYHICDELMPAAKSPFFGFLLVGIMAAVCRAINYRRRRIRTENSVMRKGADS